MATLELLTGDLTRLAVDAVVNAANETLLGGGGVDGALHRAAGPGLLAACRALPELRPGVRCATGDARLTPGFGLPARFVIHAAGPVWRGGDRGEAELLASCYRRSLELAAERGCASVAFPAISCGVYGYPIREAARVATRSVRETLPALGSPPARVVFVAFSPDVRAALADALGADTAGLSPSV